MHPICRPKPTESLETDVVIVGAGPAGLACAVELQLRGLTSLVFDKGCIVDTFFNFPTDMRFFTSRSGLEIGGLPMSSFEEQPGRIEAIDYYQGVARHHGLPIRQYEAVNRVEGGDEAFLVHTTQSVYPCREVIIATGYCHQPNLLGVHGEDSKKVSHYYEESYAHRGQDVAVIGGRKSAATAALELYRAGARFTTAVKNWIREDIEARVQNTEIRALFSSQVRAIHPDSITVDTPNGGLALPSDFVFALTGYQPDMEFLKAAGVDLDAEGRRPVLNPDTLETSRPGVHLAGVVVAGLHTHELNIEHAKEHALRIASSIARATSNALQIPTEIVAD